MSLVQISRYNRERKIKNAVLKKFRDCNALDESSAVTLDELGIQDTYDSKEKDCVDFLELRVVIEKIGDTYWLDEMELKKQTKEITILSTVVILAAIIIGIYMSITA